MQNATSVDQTSIQSPSDVPNATSDTVETVQVQTPEFAINVLKRELDDLQVKTNLIQGLDHKLVQMTESQIMDRIQFLALEAVNKFLASQNPGELPKKTKREKLDTGHGTISVAGAVS